MMNYMTQYNDFRLPSVAIQQLAPQNPTLTEAIQLQNTTLLIKYIFPNQYFVS